MLYRNILLAALLFLVAACDDDEPVIVIEEEVITTLRLELAPRSFSPTIVLSFQDLDGDGGNAPVIEKGDLLANTIYDGQITLLNESGSEVDNITEEVSEEDEEHQLFFEVGSGLNMEVSYEDQDEDGFPLGLRTTVTTGDASEGSLRIVLRHMPEKDAAGVADGDITNADGSTDIDVTFDVKVSQ